jgi:hypothetical protein
VIGIKSCVDAKNLDRYIICIKVIIVLFVIYRINELKDKLSKLNPRTKAGKAAQLELDNYQNKV